MQQSVRQISPRTMYKCIVDNTTMDIIIIIII